MATNSLSSSGAISEDRKLIKFSNYSLCVTLPKWVIKNLKWEKGDVVKMLVDEKKGEILIKKSSKSSKAEETPSKEPKKIKKGAKSRW